MANPLSNITDALGITGQQTPKFVKPEQVQSFTGPTGVSTATDYTAGVNPNQANVDFARTGLEGVLGAGLQADPVRMQQYQQAFIDERSPQLERNLANQAQAQNIQSATRGTAGGSSDLYREALQNQFANEQRGNLQNQAIQGREQLAAQGFQQNLAESGLYNQLLQQDFGNTLAGFGANQSALQGSNASNLAYSNAINQQEAARVDAENRARMAGMQNLIGLGVAGAGAYNAFGPSAAPAVV